MISNRCVRKSLVINCNSIVSKNYLRFLVDSNVKEDIRKIRMRQKWLEIYAETGSVTRTALRCGVARSTLYRWIKREKEQGKSELSDKSKRPSRLANMKITPEIETIILNLHNTRRWGAENGGYPPTQNGDIRSLF
uniref:helix-turn-helix domain-containing protein n=1 Tax=Prevotella heparinolytica TaxID=28113 RepID=UPI00359FF371